MKNNALAGEEMSKNIQSNLLLISAQGTANQEDQDDPKTSSSAKDIKSNLLFVPAQKTSIFEEKDDCKNKGAVPQNVKNSSPNNEGTANDITIITDHASIIAKCKEALNEALSAVSGHVLILEMYDSYRMIDPRLSHN